MDREAWRAAIHGVAKCRARLSDWTELNVQKSSGFLCVGLVSGNLVEKKFNYSKRFLPPTLGSWRFCIYKIMSSPNKDSFTSFFLNWMPFFFFSCLIPLASSSNTYIEQSDESGHPYLVAELKGWAVRVPQLVWCEFLYSHFIRLRKNPFIVILLSVFTTKGYWIFIKFFFSSDWDYHGFSCL